MLRTEQSLVGINSRKDVQWRRQNDYTGGRKENDSS
jgi:hypothetical protein